MEREGISTLENENEKDSQKKNDEMKNDGAESNTNYKSITQRVHKILNDKTYISTDDMETTIVMSAGNCFHENISPKNYNAKRNLELNKAFFLFQYFKNFNKIENLVEKPNGAPAKEYEFKLDFFQQQAILCLENNQSVLVVRLLFYKYLFFSQKTKKLIFITYNLKINFSFY